MGAIVSESMGGFARIQHLHHFATIARVEVEVERASKRGSARTDLRGGRGVSRVPTATSRVALR